MRLKEKKLTAGKLLSREREKMESNKKEEDFGQRQCDTGGAARARPLDQAPLPTPDLAWGRWRSGGPSKTAAGVSATAEKASPTTTAALIFV